MQLFYYLLFLSLLLVSDAHFPHHRVVSRRQYERPSQTPKRQDLGTRTFAQKSNHDDPNSSTFNQRYWVNDMFSSGQGAPIYLYVGGEVSFSYTDVTSTQWVNYAENDKAILVALEHRFFGESQLHSDLTDLTYLTVDQAMADVVDFITWYKSSINSPSSPVITLGSSYGGNLASWLRIRHPNVFSASLASSAPVQLVKDYSAYYTVVSQSIDSITGSSACTTNIHNAMIQLETTISDPANDDLLYDKFTLCYPLVDTWTERGVLSSNLNEIWATAVQYNDQATIVQYCDVMSRTDQSPLDNIAEVNRQELQHDDRYCMNSAYDSLIEFYRDVTVSPSAYVGYRQYFYLQCTQLGFFMTTGAAYPAQPFGTAVPVSLFDSQCRDVFGSIQSSDSAIARFNTEFGGKMPVNAQASRVLYSNGALDPWNGQSVLQNQSPTLLSYIIGGVGHSADIWPAYVNGPTKSQQEAMKSVLSQFVQSHSDSSSSTSSSTTTTSTVAPPSSTTTSSTVAPPSSTTNDVAPVSSTTGQASTSSPVGSSNADPSATSIDADQSSTTSEEQSSTTASKPSLVPTNTQARNQASSAIRGQALTIMLVFFSLYLCL